MGSVKDGALIAHIFIFLRHRMKARAFCLMVRGFVSRPVRETLAFCSPGN
jgi:hypothetical protein